MSNEAPTAALPASLSDWTARDLPVKRATRYSVDKRAGQPCVLAQANRSVSLLRRKLNVTPDELGSIHFSWWVKNALDGASVADPARDDAGARVVLAFEGDESKLSPRNRMLFELARTLTGEAPPYATLMYVWDGKDPVGTEVISTRSDRMRKIVVASGSDQLGSWRQFERNVVDDFRRVFGEAPGPLIGMALMTDADNTQGRVEACYGPIQLKGRNGNLLSGGLTPPDAGMGVR
jgi:hypothetical protein